MKRIPRRIFTAEFKLEAIKLVTEHGLTQAEAARKLDIARQTPCATQTPSCQTVQSVECRQKRLPGLVCKQDCAIAHATPAARSQASRCHQSRALARQGRLWRQENSR